MHDGEGSRGSYRARAGSRQPCSSNKGSKEPPVPTSSSFPCPRHDLTEHCVLLALGLQLVLLSHGKTDQKINDSVRFLCFGVADKGNC